MRSRSPRKRSRRRKSYRRSKRSRKSKRSSDCKKKLQKKIRINMTEYKSGRYSSRAQALAVSYAQVKKKYPKCKRSLSKKRK
jgi:hypothetical protein